MNIATAFARPLLILCAVVSLGACSVVYDLRQQNLAALCKREINYDNYRRCVQAHSTSYEQYEAERERLTGREVQLPPERADKAEKPDKSEKPEKSERQQP